VLAKLLFENSTLCSELYQIYLHQVVSNGAYFLQSPFVQQLPADTLIDILHSNNLPLEEIVVFRGVVHWLNANSSATCKSQQELIVGLVRYPLMEYDQLRYEVEPSGWVTPALFLEAYRQLARPKMAPLDEGEFGNPRFQERCKPDVKNPGTEIFSFACNDHPNCSAVAWPINNFSAIKSQKHVCNPFELFGLRWRLWAYPAGEAKHSDSFSVYLEAVRVKEKESYDFLRNTTFFFSLINQRNKDGSRHYPSSTNVLFNYEKCVWGNGLIELRHLYDQSQGFLDNDKVLIHLHLLDCIALDG